MGIAKNADDFLAQMGKGPKTEANGGQAAASGSEGGNNGEGGAAAAAANATNSNSGEGGAASADNGNTGEGGAAAATGTGGAAANAANASAGGNPPADQGTKTELTDEQVLEYLKTKKGKNAATLDEILDAKPAEPAKELTEEEKRLAVKDKKDKAFKYALDNKLFDTEKLQNYLRDAARTPREIAYDLFATQQKTLDATLTDEQIGERFAELNFEQLDETDYRRQLRAQEMENISKNYLNSTYPDIIGVEGTYDKHVELENKATTYKTTVDTAFEAVPKEYSYQAVDPKEKIDMKLNFKFSPESIESIKARYLTPQSFLLLQQGQIDEVGLQEAITQDLIAANLPKMLPEFLNAYSAERVTQIKMGLNGVIPQKDGIPTPSGIKTPGDAFMESVKK